MPLLKRLRALDWPTLVAELLLIFVGITAALWFDGLAESRAAARREASVLGELASALRSDTADLSFNLRSDELTRTSLDTVLAHLSRRLPYDSTMALHFGRASRFTNFLPNTSAYEYLKSLGLASVTNDGLRRDITRYYEVQHRYLTSVEGIFVNGSWHEMMAPQMIEKFDYAFFFEPAAPRDYRALQNDLTYATTLRTMGEILTWKVQITAQTLDQAEALLARIDDELNGR